LTLPIATVVGALICTAILYPVLRLRGIYFALITLTLPLLFQRLIEATRLFGGTEGLSSLDPLPGTRVVIYLAIAAMLATLFGFRRLGHSDYGLVLKAIRDNDRSVIASGINIQWYKAQAVFIAALPAAFAGALLTHQLRFVGMPVFTPNYSILPLASATVGGVGSFIGATLGAFLLVPISELFRGFGTWRVVVYSVILVVCIVGLPEGIFPYLRRRYHQFERRVRLEGGE
jgi:branched-chain amino acid transport system permease protein